MRRYLDSLRVRLLLLVLLAALPMFGLVLFTSREIQTLARTRAQEYALQLARVAAEDQAFALDNARQLLSALAEIPDVHRHDPAACSAVLARIAEGNEVYAVLAVSDLDGAVWCSSQPAFLPVNIADRSYFQRAVAWREFSVGEHGIERLTGRPTINAGYPVLNDAGRSQGVVFAAIDLRVLAGVLAEARLPSGTSLAAFTREGMVLTRFPDPDRWTGRVLPEAEIIRAVRGRRTEGVLEAHGLDGRKRLYAFVPLSTPDSRRAAWISVGLPLSVAYSEAHRIELRNHLALGVIVALMLAAVWIAGGFLVLRPVNSLLGAIRKMAAGRLDERAPILGTRELAGLAVAFNDLADQLRLSHEGLEEKVRIQTQQLWEALDDVEQRHRTLETILESLPVGVFLTRAPGGEPTLINSAGRAILGPSITVRPEGGTYSRAFEFVQDDGTPIPRSELPLAITLRDGVVSSRSGLVLRGQDGTRITLRISSAPVRDSTGRLTMAVVVIEDMTDQDALDRAKDDFVALASHQLRTPATGVKAYLSMLLDGDAGVLTATQQEFVGRADQSNDHGLRLIEELLAVARIEAGSVTLHRVPTDLVVLVREVADDLAAVLADRRQILALTESSRPARVAVDPVRMRMVFGNLIENAGKYTPAGGRIAIRFAVHPDAVEVAVSDTGVGIAPEDTSRLFQRFSRIYNPRTSDSGGTGLGLYMVKKILDLHGGTIAVDSAPGEGTTFTVRLPVDAAED